MIRVQPVGADPNLSHSSRSLAMVDQCCPCSTVCPNDLNELAHLFGGLPHGLLMSLGYQSVVARVHHPSSLLTTWHAQRCFD